ncbi:transcriptional regulator, MarR family [Catenulispora acidiphila DSM 44928]|uniref:Transcriptional regulator, MarR family n=1 Tax=Catenulispora acidiphila (strain DSM 44928 / JCM 14897 / NBRC 102108 / NRRL B-24433 / ID139908) TaxID=479433 RepID=C7Q7Q5_CATAD|nr:MarR family winged helix-turn-helix transcriptional regulator [Catenulispora acidiphila]ACU72248.1 transcriptional regulator, MarR family [Catenulispora acidiphila DSM 44928]
MDDAPPPFPDDLATLWYLIRRVATLLDRTGEALFQREIGTSLAQYLVLSVVDAHPGPLNQQAIADRLGLTKGTVSRQIDTAVAAGLMTVRTAEHNRRENLITLTPTGTHLVRQGDAAFEREKAESLPKLPPQEMRTAIRVLTAMNSALDPTATSPVRE